MDGQSTGYSAAQLIKKARNQAGRTAPAEKSLADIQRELRQRRKQLLGTYVSVRELLLSSSGVEDSSIDVLCNYLASRAICFWNFKDDEAKDFCFRFYRLSLYALSGGKISRECIDDVLQLADCLVRSRKVFTIAMKGVLPADMIGELFDFVDAVDERLSVPSFTDATMAAISVLVGSLCDPFNDTETEV